MWPADGYVPEKAPLVQSAAATAQEIQEGWSAYTAMVLRGGQEILNHAFLHIPDMTEFTVDVRLITLRQLAWAKVDIAAARIFAKPTIA